MIFAGDESPAVQQAPAQRRAPRLLFSGAEYISDRGRDETRDDDDYSSAHGHVPLIKGMLAAAKRQMYGQSLSALYRGIELPPPSSALASDADAYEVLLRNPVVAASVDKRYAAAAGKLWRLVPQADTQADSLLAAVLTDALKQIQDFYASRYLFAKAIMLGSSFAFIRCERKFVSLGGVKALWLVPTKLIEIDKRRMRWVFPRGAKVEQGKLPAPVREIWSVRQARWVPLPTDWPILDWVRCDEECRLGDGRGLWDAVYQPNYSSAVIEAMANLAIEAHGRGILDAAIDGLRRGGDDSTADLVADWTTALQEVLAGGNILVHDKADEFNVVTGGESAASVILEYMRYYDDLKRTTIMGAAAPFGGEGDAGQGSQAKTNVQKDVAEEISQADRHEIAGRIRWKLVDFIRRRNAPILREHGVDDDVVTPEYTVEAETKHDSAERLTAAESVKRMGLDLIADEVYAAAGYSKPREGDAVVKGDQPKEAAATREDGEQPVPEQSSVPEDGEQPVPEQSSVPEDGEQPVPEFNEELTTKVATWAGQHGENSGAALDALTAAMFANGGNFDEASALADRLMRGDDDDAGDSAEFAAAIGVLFDAAPIGTRSHRKDGEYEKVAEGDWRRVSDGKPAAGADDEPNGGAAKGPDTAAAENKPADTSELPDFGQYFDVANNIHKLFDAKEWAGFFKDVKSVAVAAESAIASVLTSGIADKLPEGLRNSVIADTRKLWGFAKAMGRAAAYSAWAPVFGPGALADKIAEKTHLDHDTVKRCSVIAAIADWGAFGGGLMAPTLMHIATAHNPILHYLVTISGSIGLIVGSVGRRPSMMAEAAAASFRGAGTMAKRVLDYLKKPVEVARKPGTRKRVPKPTPAPATEGQ